MNGWMGWVTRGVGILVIVGGAVAWALVGSRIQIVFLDSAPPSLRDVSPPASDPAVLEAQLDEITERLRELSEIVAARLSESAQPPEGAADEHAPRVRSPTDFRALLERARSRPPGTRKRFELVDGGCKVGFDGTSNLHDFSGSTLAVAGFVEFDPEHLEDSPTGEVVAQARTLATGDEARDRAMHEDHLQSTSHPELRFDLRSVDQLTAESAGVQTGTAHGELTIHGVRREVAVPIRFESQSPRVLVIRGEWTVKMSDHGIEPPTALGGLIRTADEVKAWFTLHARAPR